MLWFIYEEDSLTSFHLILQCGGAVDNQLLQRNGLIADLEIQQLLHVFRMVEVENLLVPVIASVHVVQENVDDLLEEFTSLRLRRFDVRQNI